MSNQYPLTADAIQTIERASQAARERHQHLIDTEHLLVGALHNDFVRQAVSQSGLAPADLQNAMFNELGIVRDDPLPSTQGMTTAAKQLFVAAAQFAQQAGHNAINSGHLMWSILTQPSPVLREILQGMPTPDLDAMRLYVEVQSPPAKPIPASASSMGSNLAPNVNTQQRRVTVSFGEPRQRKTTDQGQRGGNNSLWIALAVLAGVAYGMWVAPEAAGPFIIVLGGWLISLTLHEFAHALVAYWGGDHTVVEKGYLTMNPLRYTDPFLSLALPLLFLAIGGIGLPGGMVYIETHRLRNKYWRTAVALAGPFANFLCLVAFSAPFWLGFVTFDRLIADFTFWAALAFLCWLQVTAIMLNLLPIPPLDGFNALEPFLPREFVAQLRVYGSLGFVLVLMMLWIPATARPFFDQVFQVSRVFEIDDYLVSEGYASFRFWE